MKALAKTIGGILFWVFCLVIFLWTASLSLAELRIILPGDPIMPYVGLVLTDFGALTWLLVFIGRAKGLMQRSIAIIMLVIDLTGVILLAGGRLLTAGQTLAEVPAELGPTLIWGIIGLTLINLIAAYVFHISEPEVMKEINFGVLADRLQKEALDQAERNIEAEAQALGAVLAARATADLKYSLRLPYNDIEQARLLEDSQANKPASKQVIDAKAKDPDKSPSVFSRLFKKDKPPSPIAQPAMVTNEQTVIQQAELQEPSYHPVSMDPKPAKRNPLPRQKDFDLAASIMPGIAPYRDCPSCHDTVPLSLTHCAACGHAMTPLSQWSSKPAQEDGSQPPAPFPG